MSKNRRKDEALLRCIGTRIKRHRQLNNLSQQQLANLCNIEKSNMSRLENGRVNVTMLTLRKVCIALNVSVSSFSNGVEAEVQEA